MDDEKYLIVSLTEIEEKRIFSKVTKDSNTGCWNWTGALLKNRGYGVINFRGKTETVHRIIYAWVVSPIPRGVGKGIPVLDHVVCDNPACCNPEHVSLTTQKRNVLRGNSPMAINSRKTHCIKGHLLPENPNETWGKNRKGRRCVTCRLENVHRRKKERSERKIE